MPAGVSRSTFSVFSGSDSSGEAEVVEVGVGVRGLEVEESPSEPVASPCPPLSGSRDHTRTLTSTVAATDDAIAIRRFARAPVRGGVCRVGPIG